MQALHAQLDLARQECVLLQRLAPGISHPPPNPASEGHPTHYPPGALLAENKKLHAHVKELEAQINGCVAL
jgi:hypothetical protein